MLFRMQDSLERGACIVGISFRANKIARGEANLAKGNGQVEFDEKELDADLIETRKHDSLTPSLARLALFAGA